MRIAYLDCFAGVSGDMFLGALVDAGVPRSILENATAAMKLGASLRFETVDRSGISATKVHVLEGDRLADAPPVHTQDAFQHQSAPEPHSHHPEVQHQHKTGHAHTHPHTHDEAAEPHTHEHPHVHGRSLTAIRGLIQDSGLTADVKAFAIRTFELLGQSEAKIHNVAVDDIHFHEVGALDAIVDIVAASAGIVHLNIGSWHSSPINVGGGMVQCAHGTFPVPAPATADLLRGVPTYSAHVQKELVTPTGAALLRTLAPSFGPQPAMAVEQIGYGAGTRNPPDFPNVLRLSIGESGESTDVRSPFVAQPHREMSGAAENSQARNASQTVTVLETALDDATPQLLAYVTEQALKLGALDVMLTAVIMKKGRPGTLLTVLTHPEDAGRFEQMLLRETTTLGIRIREDRRTCLDRDHVTVSTLYGQIRVKTGSQNGETFNATPEFEDCRRAAEAHQVPLKQVQQAASSAFTQEHLTR